jgi:hypothetical protein
VSSQAPLTLWPAQRDFFEAGPQPTLFLGGVGAGKTYIGIMKMLYLLDMYPGSRGAIVRQRFQQLKKTTAATLWKMLPKDRIARRNDNEGTLTLSNGSQLLLMHLDKPDSITNLKSMELNFAYVDQLEDVSAEAWDTLWERLGRWSGAMMRGGWPKNWPYRNRLGDHIPPRYLFASAYSPGYENWITSRFWEHGQERARYAAEGYQVFIGSTRDNLALSDEYVASRLAMGSEYVRRFVDATEWGAKEGRIFELHPDSIIDPTQDMITRIRYTMRLHRVYDHGEAVPSACLWYATDSEGNVYYYREYGAADKLVSDHRDAIYQLSKLDGPGQNEPPSYYSNLADPAIFAKSRGRSVNSAPTWSVADEFNDRRIIDPKTAIYWRPANNDEAMTLNRVREYLRIDPKHRSPFTNRMGSPRVFFLRRTPDYPLGCYEVLTDIRAAKRKMVGTAPDGSKIYGDDRDDAVRDHWLDCVRYSLGMRPSVAAKVEQIPTEPGTIRMSDYDKLIEGANIQDRISQRRNWRGKHAYGY